MFSFRYELFLSTTGEGVTITSEAVMPSTSDAEQIFLHKSNKAQAEGCNSILL